MRISDWSSDVCSSDLAHSVIISRISLRVLRTMKTPRRGMTVTSPSCSSRASASRIGVRLMPSCSESCRSSSFNWASSRSEEHTSELQSLMRISYSVFCLKQKTYQTLTDKVYLHNYTVNTPAYTVTH